MTNATVRVLSSSGTKSEMPERARLERAAELLKMRGFKVLRIGRYGVNIQGDEKIFARELGVEVSAQNPVVEKPKPLESDLDSLIDLVEVAATPTYFK